MMEENKLITLLTKHWSKILLGVLAVATVAAWSTRLSRSHQTESKHDFLTAQLVYESFNRGEYLPVQSLEATQLILERHPELHPKYDPLLALAFFSQHNTAEGVRCARSLITHAEPQLPLFYKEYAHTSLLISEGHYLEAYQAATALEEKLASQSDYQTLDGMNTLRLLFLADRLEDGPHRQAHFEKLSHHPAFPSIASLFREGNISLIDYFKLRS